MCGRVLFYLIFLVGMHRIWSFLPTLKVIPNLDPIFLGTTCSLQLFNDQIADWELSSFHFSIILLSCFLFVYGKSHFYASFYFLYQVKVGFEVLQVLLFIKRLSPQAQDVDLYQDYCFYMEGQHEKEFLQLGFSLLCGKTKTALKYGPAMHLWLGLASSSTPVVLSSWLPQFAHQFGGG